MKILLVGEYRDGRLLPATYEPLAFARNLGAEAAMVLVGSPEALPVFDGSLYLADVATVGDYQPESHAALVVEAARREQAQLVVLPHSAYGWDLAPRVALALDAAQISEVIDWQDGTFVVPACNGKLRRSVRSRSAVTVVTLQAGAFVPDAPPAGTPRVEMLAPPPAPTLELLGYEAASPGAVDLTRAEIIVSAGRGIGKPENLPLVEALAKVLGGELGASRPVVDAGWVEHSRQVGSTGQTVAPRLYVACGISGAVQHLAGMKRSEFIVAVNTDRDAPIVEIADVLVLADLKNFLPVLTEKLKTR